VLRRVLVVLCALTGSAAAATPPAPPAPPAIDLRLGIAGGGSAFLSPLHGPVDETTTRLTAAAFVRLRLPRVSWRVVEVFGVWPHGIGMMLKNTDLELGPLRLHLLDVGVFYALSSPITVQRVERRWDAVVGASTELELPGRLSATLDFRMFSPLDLFGAVTEHGDAARLIGEEILKGGQLWAGMSYRW
jgi:hypothetical protein